MSQLDERIAPAGRLDRWWPLVEPTPRWIRVRLGDELLASSRRALLLIDYGPHRLPTYFIPIDDVRRDALVDASTDAHGRETWTVRAGGKEVQRGAYAFVSPEGDLSALAGHVSFRWDEIDWYEEDERVFVHARDPHKRVDVARSTRHVRVEIDGITVAESRRPTLLFETTLPARYYLPEADVRMDLLIPSDTVTACPYKGAASYFSMRAGDVARKDIAWTYRSPIPENPRIRNLICFFNEHVDLFVDGEAVPRPTTPWS